MHQMLKLFPVLLLVCGCAWEMVSPPAPAPQALARVAVSVRYLDSVFAAVTIRSNTVYAANVFNPLKGISENLLLDFYSPTGDTAGSRWPLLYIYGGGFEGGSKTAPQNVLFCKNMAKRGYPVFAIDYRKFPKPNSYSDSMRIVLGTSIAGSDARAAIRFVRSRSGQYRIDPDRIAVVGSSSGAFVAMAAGFWQEIDSLNTSTPGYSGEPVIVGALSGGLPVAAVSEIEAGEPPVYLIHCTDDATVPWFYAQNCYDRAVIVGLPATNWWIDGDCHGLGGLAQCCASDFYTNLCFWIYGEFNI